jgi:streptomycin 6-kinase
MTTPHVPQLDDELRRRLGRRFGATIESWLDELPPVLVDLADRWRLNLGALIQRGTMSVVIRCRTVHGHPAVLKISPDRRRIQDEAAALTRWTTTHVPAVLAVDKRAGALLIEAIEPGQPLADSAYPHLDTVSTLVTALHAHGSPDPTYRSVADRVTYLYAAGTKNYTCRPGLAAFVPPELYERGKQLAVRLAGDAPATVLLHGDLTPANILDGGNQRGLVAIDPAPCVGDPAFDAIDLVLWRADNAQTITARVEQLAPAIGTTPRRLTRWCTAFAAMTALELAEASDATRECVDLLIDLANASP